MHLPLQTNTGIKFCPFCSFKSSVRLTSNKHTSQTMSGMRATYRFRGEQVHAFESFPSTAEASNEYESADETRQNHAFSGKLDGGVAMPTLKSSGPYAALVTALKVRSSRSL